MVLGTAGHVDHGKTSLVKALTGIDTDRLAEEKRRGITIELGFAHLALPDGTVAGMVDVPGHERFVRAMAAGAFGLDVVMLVVAVDEGVMPQTREHLDICRLLGVQQGVVALTKMDMAVSLGADLVDMARADLQEALKGSFLEGAKIIGVSSRTGEGLDALKAELARLASLVQERPAEGPAYLPLDRAFTVKGFGTVVTGTLFCGSLKPDELVDLVPGGPSGLRVRGAQVHGQAATVVQAGMRSAINLAGIETAQVQRGMVLASAGSLEATRMLDVDLELLASAPRALKTRSKTLLHLGTGVSTATITLLDRAELSPGERAPVQLTLGQPIAALHGQRFILRGFSKVPGRGGTLGGGVVLDPQPRRHRRKKAEAAEAVNTLREGTPEQRLLTLYREAGFAGAKLNELARRQALPPKLAERALSLLTSRGEVLLFDKADRAGIAKEHFAHLGERVLEVVRTFAEANPLAEGLSREALRTSLSEQLSPKLLARALEELSSTQRVELEGERVRLVGGKAKTDAAAAPLLARIGGALSKAGLAPPRVGELAAQLGEPEQKIKEAIKLLRSEGKIVRVLDDMYFDADAISSLKQRLVALLETQREIDIQGFKDLVGQTRKWTVPLGEYFDQEKVTLRIGDKRVLRGGRA
jgi:selenocysteine-specific elongation factor